MRVHVFISVSLQFGIKLQGYKIANTKLSS